MMGATTDLIKGAEDQEVDDAAQIHLCSDLHAGPKEKQKTSNYF